MTRISRRQFARTIGAAAGVTVLPRARGDQKKPTTSASTSTGAGEAEARVEMIVARYGGRLSAAERADLLRLSKEAQLQLDKLRAYVIEDGDEPAHVFRAPRKRR